MAKVQAPIGGSIHAARRSVLDNTGGSVEFPASPSRIRRPGACVVRNPPHTWISNHARPVGGPRGWKPPPYADFQPGRFLTVRGPGPGARRGVSRHGPVNLPCASRRCPSTPSIHPPLSPRPQPARAVARGAHPQSGRQLAGPGPSRATACGAPNPRNQPPSRGFAARQAPCPASPRRRARGRRRPGGRSPGA